MHKLLQGTPDRLISLCFPRAIYDFTFIFVVVNLCLSVFFLWWVFKPASVFAKQSHSLKSNPIERLANVFSRRLLISRSSSLCTIGSSEMFFLSSFHYIPYHNKTQYHQCMLQVPICTFSSFLFGFLLLLISPLSISFLIVSSLELILFSTLYNRC